MKKIVLLIALFLLLSTFVYAQNFSSKEQKLAIFPNERSLRIGEVLQYSVEWLGIPVGKIILEVRGIEEIDGSDCYHIVGRALPNKFLSKLYDVEYIVHTYIDVKNGYTIRFEKTRRMKDKFNYVEIDFDHQKKEAIYRASGSAPLLVISEARQELENSVPVSFKIIDGTQDLFSGLYYLRLLDIKENQNYAVSVYYEQRNWSVKTKIGKPFIRDIRRKGTFVVFEASLSSDLSKFILGKSHMSVYLTADSRRIPLEFKIGTSLGAIRGIIQDIPN